MGASRVFRIVEGSLVVLFFWESARLVFANLINLTTRSIETGQASLITVNGHIMLLVALAVPWFAPRNRASLPRTLALCSAVAALLRVVASVNVPLVQLGASVGVVGFSGMYLASLVRANWRSWVTVIVVGGTIDVLLRISDSYDPSVKTAVLVSFADGLYRVPWLVFQLLISICALLTAWGARRSARSERYEPASLSIWGGLGVGGFFAVEFLVLGYANVAARWTSVDYNVVAPWIALFGMLPLIPRVRWVTSHLLRLFDSRLRGWVWVLLILLALVAGNRVGGPLGVAALVLAHFAVISSLWWIPSILDLQEVEQVGPSFTLGMIVFAVLAYAYCVSSVELLGSSRLRDLDLISVLVAGGMVGLVKLVWREDDPWEQELGTTSGLEPTFAALALSLSILLIGLPGDPPRPVPKATFSVATYNVNSGFDADGTFQLDLAARTIEASLADIVVLQRADTGRPAGFGADQVEFLARRLGMYQQFSSGASRLVGVAVLSRWPIIEHASTILPSTSGPTSALKVVVRDATSGRTITVIAAELAEGTEQARLNQLYALQSLAGEASPLAIGIDLASTPDDPTYQQMLASGLLDPDVVLGIEQGYTLPASNPTARHDYVFVRGLIPLASRHVNSPASTHRLVVVELGFPQ